MSYRLTRQLGIFAAGGFENNNFASLGQDTDGVTWRIGANWRPSRNTKLEVFTGSVLRFDVGNGFNTPFAAHNLVCELQRLALRYEDVRRGWSYRLGADGNYDGLIDIRWGKNGSRIAMH